MCVCVCGGRRVEAFGASEVDEIEDAGDVLACRAVDSIQAHSEDGMGTGAVLVLLRRCCRSRFQRLRTGREGERERGREGEGEETRMKRAKHLVKDAEAREYRYSC